MELEARNVPPDLSQDCRIARRCKLFLGRELERGARVQDHLFVGPPMERRNPEVIGSSVGLVPINALVATEVSTSISWPERGSGK
jgi:hypothetical protein